MPDELQVVIRMQCAVALRSHTQSQSRLAHSGGWPLGLFVSVSQSPRRYAHRFLSHHGVPHLSSVLSLAYTRPPANIVRLGIAAAEVG